MKRPKRYQYQNTRQWVRLPADWYVKYVLADGQGPEALARIRDISAGGLRLLTRERIPAGTALRLKINVPPILRTVPAVGRVVRVQTVDAGVFEWGVVLEQMAEMDRAELSQQIGALAGRGWVTRHRGAWWRAIS